MKVALNECISSQQFIRFYAKNSLFFLVLVLCIVMLLLPGFLRHQESIVGNDGYYYLNAANELKTSDFGGRGNYMPLGWAYVLAGISYITGLSVEIISKILLFLLGIGSLILFYLIMNDYKQNIKLFVSGVLVLSPAFIYLFSVNNRFAFPIFLSLLLFYFILNERYFLAVLFSLLLPFFGTLIVLLVGLSALFYFYFKRKKLFARSVFFVFVLLLISFLLNSYLNWGVVIGGELSLFSFISDFGAEHGFSFFAFLLVCFGLLFFWRRRNYVLLYVGGFILFLISFKLDWLIFYLNFIICFLAGLCFFKLYNRKWESKFVGNLTLWILVCGLIFSGVSYAASFDRLQPDDELFVALDEIPEDSVVFSHYSNGYWIEYSGKKSFMNPFFKEIKDLEQKLEESDDMFYSRDIYRTTYLFDKHKINYIFIDKKMLDGLVWSKDDEGLLFLLDVSRSFELVYRSDNFGVWKYKDDI